MDADKARAAFENAMAFPPVRYLQWPSGEYIEVEVERAWQVWQAARADAFEEAIETCESIASSLLDASITAVEHVACSDRNDAMRCGAEDCADAIRALAAAEKEPR